MFSMSIAISINLKWKIFLARIVRRKKLIFTVLMIGRLIAGLAMRTCIEVTKSQSIKNKFSVLIIVRLNVKNQCIRLKT